VAAGGAYVHGQPTPPVSGRPIWRASLPATHNFQDFEDFAEHADLRLITP
jgi:hypothetical protein